MAVLALCLVLLLAMTGHSSATFCVCKDGLSEPVLQKDIDYACGAGADCGPIKQNGVCFNPNTVKAHCDYAVNSYFQRKGQIVGSCDFSGTATQSPSAPNQSSGCVYQSTPGTSTTPSTTNPSSTGGTGTTSSTTNPSVFGLGPTGSGLSSTDSSAGVTLHQTSHVFYSFFTLTLLFSGFICWRV